MMHTQTLERQTLERLKEAVGPGGWLTAPDDIHPYVTEQRGLYTGETPLVVRPRNTGEVIRLVQICAETGTAIVPQGGNTGLTRASVPIAGSEIVLSLGRMNRIIDIDPVNYTITVEAGAVLADIQAAAAEADRLFPLSLGAEGSCQIGGNLSTNAGGVGVLRYGNARELVLGIEAVLPDGSVFSDLTGLRKNNTGYDLKHLFIGGEGTLGIITKAVLKLFPKPRDMETALVALPDVEAVLTFYANARAECGDVFTAFEMIPRFGLELVREHLPELAMPIAGEAPWLVLMELSSTAPPGTVRPILENLLEKALEADSISDAVIASSRAQRAELWRFRETLPEAQKYWGASIKHDVSVPISRIATFIARTGAAICEHLPGARPFPFGHIGDGNIHYNVSQPENMAMEAFFSEREAIHHIVDTIVAELGGSFSAEHGIGSIKIAQLQAYKDPVALALMGRIKHLVDPGNIMNPGKVLPPSSES